MDQVITAGGVDVSKGKSMIAVRRPGGKVVLWADLHYAVAAFPVTSAPNDFPCIFCDARSDDFTQLLLIFYMKLV